MAKLYGFAKAEKLKSRKQIDILFKDGVWLTAPPVRLAYRLPAIEETDHISVQAGVTVSKRHFKKAVDRNRIKRLLREAYRLQKKELMEAVIINQVTLHLFFVYTGRELPSFEIMKTAVAQCLQKLIKKIKPVNSLNQQKDKER